MPFSYCAAQGLDCCTFTFGAIHAQTGLAIGRQFAGAYATRRESLQCMKKYCGKPYLSEALGKLMLENRFHCILPAFAQRGDAVLVPQVAGAAGRHNFFGILDLNGRDVLSVGENGLRRYPINGNCTAWRIS
jgi:hypothetical protein